MITGNFETFVDLISPLSNTYSNYKVGIQILNRPELKFRYDGGFPLYEIEVCEYDISEICFMVKGLGEDDTEKISTINVEEFVNKINLIKNSCKDHQIVLAEMEIDYDESDEDGEKGDFINYHLPVKEIKTSSDDEKNIFFLNILLYEEDTEHIHYGNIYKPESEVGVISKPDS